MTPDTVDIRTTLKGRHDGAPVPVRILDACGTDYSAVMDVETGDTLNEWVEALYHDDIQRKCWEVSHGGDFKAHRN